METGQKQWKCCQLYFTVLAYLNEPFLLCYHFYTQQFYCLRVYNPIKSDNNWKFAESDNLFDIYRSLQGHFVGFSKQQGS